jgi:hypothetical protein
MCINAAAGILRNTDKNKGDEKQNDQDWYPGSEGLVIRRRAGHLSIGKAPVLLVEYNRKDRRLVRRGKRVN